MSKDLKVGDAIYVQSRFVKEWQKYTIERVTATMYVSGGRRFYKDLRIVGADTYGPHRGHLWSPEIEMQVRIQKASTALDRIKVSADNIDAAEAFIAATSKVNA